LLEVLETVRQGQHTQAEAARILGLSSRQIRRLLRRLEAEGAAALVHGLRGKPSNHRIDPELRERILEEYRRCYGDFGPSLASEKLAEQRLLVAAETLRGWLLAEGLWQQEQPRASQRRRRPRWTCFGELLQMESCVRNWTEGCGKE